jgi:hypothetical protein
MTTTGKATMVAATSVFAAALIGAAINCGGVSTNDVGSARNQATSASCDYYKMCDQIGTGLSYDTYADCMTQVLGSWTSGWPTSQCQGHIDQSKLTVCLDAIKSTTDCNGIAVLLTLSKCTAASVCSAGVVPDAATD